MDNSGFNEIRIDDKDLVLKGNRVNSSIIPQNIAQMKRKVIVEGDVELNGAVYGDSVLIHNGPVIFNRSVFAKDEVIVNSTVKGDITFAESVGAGSVVSCIPLNEKVKFASDINSRRVNLKNTYVGGSVFADEIQLDGCVVIGGVFATKKLVISNSIIGTFNSQEVMVEGKNYLIYPSCFSVEPIKATSTAELINITLADLMGLFKGEPEKESTGYIPINLESDAQRADLKSDDGTMLLVHSYSVAGKVLIADMQDFEKLNNHFLINAGALSSQLLKEYAVESQDGKEIPLSLNQISAFFFDILGGMINIQPMDDNLNLDSIC